MSATGPRIRLARWRYRNPQTTICRFLGCQCQACDEADVEWGLDRNWPKDILEMIRDMIHLSLRPGLKRRLWADVHAVIRMGKGHRVLWVDYEANKAMGTTCEPPRGLDPHEW